MANDMTKLSDLINPQVMADMISAEVKSKIRFSPLAKIDDTLVGQPGNTITVPKFAYIGDAEDIAEGVAMGTVKLTASSTQATVKKAGKAVEFSDESVLSGYGDPVGEMNKQLSTSIAQKIDKDCVIALAAATLVFDGSAAQISYNGIVDAVDKFGDEDDEPKVLLIHPNQKATLRKDPNFIDKNKFGGDVMVTGAIGEFGGCQVITSNKVPVDATTYSNFIVKAGALTIFMKRRAEVETDRDILAKTTVVSTDEHYVAYLSDASRVVKATFKK